MSQITESSQSRQTTVVVPCYNEAQRFNTLAYDGFLSSNANITLLFVDDGSTDETPQVIEQLRQRHPQQVCTLRMSSNVGKAEAVRRGVQIALRRKPTFVGYWDADLATPLDEIPDFCRLLTKEPNLSLVMGSRVALLGRQIRRRRLRHFLGRAFATAASIVLRLPVYDTQCGAKIFRATTEVELLFAQPFGARWIFDVELLARMVAVFNSDNGALPAEQRIYEYPLQQWQDVRGSRIRKLDFLVAARDLVAIHWRYMRSGARSAHNLPKVVKYPSSNVEHRDAA